MCCDCTELYIFPLDGPALTADDSKAKMQCLDQLIGLQEGAL